MNRFRYNADPTERAHRPKVGCWRCGSQKHEICDANGYVLGKAEYIGKYVPREYGVIPLDEWNAGRRDFPVLPR